MLEDEKFELLDSVVGETYNKGEMLFYDMGNPLNTLLKHAFAHYLEGRLSEAEALYRQVLETDARQPLALSMLGMILVDSQRMAEAESVFLRHLVMDPDNPLTLHNLGRILQSRFNDKAAVAVLRRAGNGKPDLAPIFNDMAVSLHRLGQFEEALAALDHALVVDPYFAVAHDNRGVVLYDCRRFAEAAEAHVAALTYTSVNTSPKRISILLHYARAAYEMAELSAAEQACRSILEMDAANAEAIEHLAKIMYRLRRDAAAVALLNQLARQQGLGIKERPEHPEATILVLGGAGASHVPTRYLFDPALFAKMTLILLSPDQPDAPLGSVTFDALAEADLIFNTLGEVEKNGGQFDAVNMLAERLEIPLLNPPERVLRTGRDRAPELFGDIPGLRVPGVRRMSRDELMAPYFFVDPFLIRPVGTHSGDDLALVKTAIDLTDYLARTPYGEFLLTDFYDFKDSQAYYRKYRFIFIDRQPYPYHLAIAENWLVHYWRAEMRCADWKRQEEDVFLSDWRQVFGARAAAVVGQVGQRMDIDYGGFDCSILPGGEVLFFEANACMLVHFEEDEADFPCKNQAVSCIRDAVTHMVKSRIFSEEGNKI